MKRLFAPFLFLAASAFATTCAPQSGSTKDVQDLNDRACATEQFGVGTGGVTANTLVITDASSPAKVIAATGSGAYGVALSTVAAAGAVNVQRYGQVACVMDNNATAGDLVIPGTSTVTDCRDSGQNTSSAISTATRIIGVLLTSATAGQTAIVELSPAHFGTMTTAGSAGSSGQTQINNAGAFAGVNNYVIPSSVSGASQTASLPNTGWSTFNSGFYNDFSLGFIQVGALTSSGSNLRGIMRTISVPYTLYVVLACEQGYGGEGANLCGIYLSDGTKYEGFTLNLNVQTVSSANQYARVETWTNSSTFGSVLADTISTVTSTFAVEIHNDGTHRTFYYWKNGAPVQVYQEATGTFMAETQGGVGALSGNGVSTYGISNAKLLYWSVQ